MRLADCKVGERIKVYLNDHGFISTTPTEKVIEATVFARSSETDENEELYYLGWKANETRPSNARIRTNVHEFNVDEKVSNQHEFCWRVFGYREWEVEELSPVSLPQWKLFVNNKEGECPCGTNRSVCRYHG